jgi:hypothetical protein
MGEAHTRFAAKRGTHLQMIEFKVGDHVRILAGAAHFIGVEGIIYEIRPHDGGVATMDRHIVEFQRKEKRSFFCAEMIHIKKSKD